MTTSPESSLVEPNERDRLMMALPKHPLLSSRVVESGTSSLTETTRSSGLVTAFFVLGVGCLLPFNALLLVLDYYALLFPKLLITQYVTNAYTFPFMVSGFLLASFPLPSSLRSGSVFFSYAMLTVISMLYPLLTTRNEPFLSAGSSVTSPQFLASITLTLILGFISALVQTVLFGIVSLLPNRTCITAYNSGGATASVLLVAMRIVSRFLFDQGDAMDPSTLRSGFTLFFFICAALSFCCVLVFFWIYTRSIEYNSYIKSPRTDNFRTQSRVESSPLLQTMLATFFDIRVESLSMVSCFLITLMLFPGITTMLPNPMHDYAMTELSSWFPLYVVAIFAFGDVAGRSLWSEKIAIHHPDTLPYIAASRFILIPIIVLQWAGPFPTSSLTSLSTVFVLALSNGFVMNMAFLIAPTKTTCERREAAGRFLFLMLNIGLSLGTGCGWLLQSLITRIR